jgi:hypothetical protein
MAKRTRFKANQANPEKTASIQCWFFKLIAIPTNGSPRQATPPIFKTMSQRIFRDLGVTYLDLCLPRCRYAPALP